MMRGVGIPYGGVSENQKYKVGDLIMFGDWENLMPIIGVNYAGQRTVAQVLVKTWIGNNTWVKVNRIQKLFTPEKDPEYFL